VMKVKLDMVDRSVFFPIQTKRKTLQRRGGAKPLSLSALALPAVDAAALFAVVALFGWSSRLCAAYGIVAFLGLAARGMQRGRINPTVSQDLPQILSRLSVPLLLVAVLALSSGASAARLPDLLRVTAAAVVLVPVGRGVTYGTIRLLRARGYLLERAVIIGAGQIGAQVATILREHREYGLEPVGFLDSLEGSGLSMPILGDAHALVPVMEDNQVTTVIIAFGAIAEGELVGVLRACDALPVEVYVVPRFFEMGIAQHGVTTDDVWGIPLIHLRRSALRPRARMTKRAFDLVLATVGLLLLAPLFLAIALAVRRSSPGPVFFRQPRVGKDERLFELLKFRTMRVNDDSDTTWSVADDARVTRIGRFLRRTYLDELPQLLNVLRGEMSLVGPRPERPHFAQRFAQEVPRYDDRHRVPGGITGWAQVHGLRGDTPIPDRARFDNHYIENWSLWRDVVILARTITSVLLGR
jgi:exopolysaccharide biosynthesis polyprenyl glycosylphosphotransferase